MSSTEHLQPLDLILDSIRHTPLQDTGNVSIQLAVLLAQRGHRHHYCRLNLVQVQQHVTQLGADGPSAGAAGGFRGHIVEYTSL
jgi:hypothetical protein